MVERVDYRLEIEGFGLQFVTHPDLAQTLTSGSWDDAVRRVGLRRQDLKISHKVDIPTAELDGDGMKFSIVDSVEDGHPVLEWCSSKPLETTYLLNEVSTTDTSFTVASASNLTTSGANAIMHIGTEAVRITNIVGTTLTVSRGQWGTIAQKHYADDSSQRVGLTPLFKLYPTVLEGRRVRLYRYIRGTDSLTGDGQIIWRGFLSRDVSFDGIATWELNADPIIKRLDVDIGKNLDNQSFRPRGVHYPPTHPLRFTVVEHSSGGAGTGGSDPQNEALIQIPGTANSGTGASFFESQQDFVDEVNVQLQAQVSGWANGSRNTAVSVKAVVEQDGGWSIRYLTASSLPAKVSVKDLNRQAKEVEGLQDTRPLNSDGLEFSGTISSSTIYSAARSGIRSSQVDGAGRVPRGIIGIDGSGRRTVAGLLGLLASAPRVMDLYVGGTFDLTGQTVSVTYKFGDLQEPKTTYEIDWDSTNRKITFRRMPASWFPLTRFGAGDAPELTLAVSYGTGELQDLSGGGKAITSDLADFRDYLVTNSPAFCNLGQLPFITSEELADWTDAVRDAAGRGVTHKRIFSSTGAQNLLEMIQAECQILGLYPYIDGDAKIALRPIETPTDVDWPDHVLTRVRTDRFPSWERNRYGSYGTWTLKTGFEVHEDKYRDEIKVISDISIAVNRNAKEVVIKPKSVEAYPVTATTEDVFRDRAQKLLSLFGLSTEVLEIDLLRSDVQDVLLGDVVNMTIPYFPDPETGERGLTQKQGIVISREQDLFEGSGKVEVLVSGDGRPGGHAPTAYVTASTNITGNQWTIGVTGDYAAVGDSVWHPNVTDASDIFFVGDRVRVSQMDTTTQTIVDGEIDAISGNNITITFGSTWTPGSDDWVLEFSDAATSGMTAAQLKYTFVSGTELRISPAVLAAFRAFLLR